MEDLILPFKKFIAQLGQV
jgi:hypothetical protein